MATILLLEPDRILADVYRAALAYNGHDVYICASAQSAIFCADEHRPDLLLLELQLVGHSGIEFLYEFRSYADWTEVPVIILSQVPAAELQGSRELLHGLLGVREYHYKPQTSLAKLASAVEETLAVAA